MSVSSHKIYGPKGMGALIVRAEVELHPLHHGGVQERGLRGGTENVARSEEHTSELQSLMRISYAVFCLKKQTRSAHTSRRKTTKRSPSSAHQDSDHQPRTYMHTS